MSEERLKGQPMSEERLKGQPMSEERLNHNLSEERRDHSGDKYTACVSEMEKKKRESKAV